MRSNSTLDWSGCTFVHILRRGWVMVRRSRFFTGTRGTSGASPWNPQEFKEVGAPLELLLVPGRTRRTHLAVRVSAERQRGVGYQLWIEAHAVSLNWHHSTQKDAIDVNPVPQLLDHG